MNFELLEQSIQYSFYNPKYGKEKIKSRIFRNLKKDTPAAELAKVGDALATLQGDELIAATLIQKQAIPLINEGN